jgi:hypothetical protein
VIDTQVAGSADDAFHSPVGWPNYSQTATVVYVGSPGSGGPTYGGWRWSGLAIPEGAVVLEAYVELSQAGWGHTVTTTLSLQNAADPVGFSQFSTPFHRWQERTGFETQWSWPRSVPGTWIVTPDIAAGIQELVDRYAGIDALVLLESGEGVASGQYHEWGSFDASPALAARLYITWVMPEAELIETLAASNAGPSHSTAVAINRQALEAVVLRSRRRYSRSLKGDPISLT